MVFEDDINAQRQKQICCSCHWIAHLGEATNELYPQCGSPLNRVDSANGWLWSCTNRAACNASFPDNNGKPGERVALTYSEEPCPKCSEEKVRRLESKENKGRFFHVCGACDSFFGDEDGLIGEKKSNAKRSSKAA